MEALGMLVVSGEYSTGMIRATLAAVPPYRSTPGALVAVVGLILPVLCGLLLPSWGTHIAAYLPTGAGASFSTNLPPPNALSRGSAWAPCWPGSSQAWSSPR